MRAITIKKKPSEEAERKYNHPADAPDEREDQEKNVAHSLIAGIFQNLGRFQKQVGHVVHDQNERANADAIDRP